MAWFRRSSAPAPIMARPIVLPDPGGPPDIDHATYRLGAILRDREHRRGAGEERRPDYDGLSGEALHHLGVLLARGMISWDDVLACIAQLRAEG